MVLSGELEVIKGRGGKMRRLGFLSDGSFFGEASILSEARSMEMRTRTIKAVTDSELCFLTRDDIVHLSREYNELAARLKRFENVGQMRVTKKKKMELFGRAGGKLLKSYSEDFKAVQEVVTDYNRQKSSKGQNAMLEAVDEGEPTKRRGPPFDNRGSSGREPMRDSDDKDEKEDAYPSMVEIRAALRLKKLASNARAKVRRKQMTTGNAMAHQEGAEGVFSPSALDSIAGLDRQQADGDVIAAQDRPGSPDDEAFASGRQTTRQQLQLDELSDKVSQLESKLDGKLDSLGLMLEKLFSHLEIQHRLD